MLSLSTGEDPETPLCSWGTETQEVAWGGGYQPVEKCHFFGISIPEAGKTY